MVDEAKARREIDGGAAARGVERIACLRQRLQRLLDAMAAAIKALNSHSINNMTMSHQVVTDNLVVFTAWGRDRRLDS